MSDGLVCGEYESYRIITPKDIPKGYYCHDEEDMKLLCPYWSIVRSRPEQENGYCAYLKKGDWENPHLLNLLWDQVSECDKT